MFCDTVLIKSLFFSFTCVFIFISKDSLADNAEAKLVKEIMTNYNPMVRPAENSSLPLEVEFGMALHHIIDVDEKNQLLTTNCWITQKWTDHHLKWNVSEHSGITVIRIPYQHIWKPDIILYNNADPHYLSSVINTNMIVSHTGEVVWLSHGIYVSVCDINVEHFPFDVQICTLKWASWTYDGFQVDLLMQSEEGDKSNYQKNGEFELISFKSYRTLEYYSCCVEPYPDVTFVIKLKRRPMFYVFNLILPCLLINGIALLVFYVPSVSGEKVTLGISALLSMTVFLMTIRDTLPPTEKMPLISLYYGVSTCLVSFSASLSVVTLNISYKGMHGQPVPPLVRKIFLKRLARLLFINFDVDKERPQAQVNPRTGSRLKNEAEGVGQGAQPSAKTFTASSTATADETNKHWPSRSLSHQAQSARAPTKIIGDRSSHSCHVESECLSCSSGIAACCRNGGSSAAIAVREVAARHERRVRARERAEQDNLEWKQVSVVVDRALLGIFFLITIVSTAVILYPQMSL